MRINVSHIAKLGNLKLSPSEIKDFEKQLISILTYIETLNKADTKNTKETSQTTDLKNILREDVVTSSLSQEETLRGASESLNGFFKTEQILIQD